MKEAAATQQFIAIEEIKQETIVLRNGGLRKVLLANGINFDLKSEEEQGLIIYSFQNFLNALNFSLQIYIRSRRLNIENYLNKLSGLQEQESFELLKNMIGEYREFIKSFVAQNAIMDKAFFVVVPYDPVQFTQAGKSFFKKMMEWLHVKKRKPPEEALLDEQALRQQSFTQNSQQLEQRVEQVISGLSQIGLRAVPLNDAELIELFYNIYNPETTEKTL